MNADEKLSRADGGDWDGLEADVVDAAVNGGLHGCGDRAGVSLDCRLSGKGHRAILDDVGDRDGAKGGMGGNRG